MLAPFPADLSRKASRTLAGLGVQVRTSVRVKSVDKEGLTYQGPDGLVRLPRDVMPVPRPGWHLGRSGG